MDGYATEQSYDLYRLFTMPDDSGGTRALAVSATSSQWVTALYGLIVASIFGVVWALLVTIAIMLPTPWQKKTEEELHKQRKNERHAVHVVLLNSPGATFSTIRLMYRVARVRFRAGDGRDLLIAFYGAIFMFLAIAIFCGTTLGGTFYPANLSIGNVAPVAANASLLFYPTVDTESAEQLAKMSGVLAPAALRAIGAVDAAKVAWEDKVRIETADTMSGDERGFFITYEYNITGIDLGLQQGSDLILTVNTTCETRYDWILPRTNESESLEQDEYLLLPSDAGSLPFNVSKNANRIVSPPTASFLINPLLDSNITDGTTTQFFAIVIGSAYRYSITNSTDPWYATESLAAPEPIGAFEVPYRIRDRRPPLACAQRSGWGYHDHQSRTSELGNMPGLQVPEVLIDVLRTGMATPSMYNIGLILQDASLISRFTRTGRIIDASSSGIYEDMERLIWATYIFDRNLIKDTTGAPEQRSQMENIFLDSNGTLREGSTEFVITSLEVSTLSLGVLIGTPVLFVGLMLLEACLWFLPSIIKSRDQNASWWQKIKSRFHDLERTELEQYIDDTLGEGDSTLAPAHGQRIVIRRDTKEPSSPTQPRDVERDAAISVDARSSQQTPINSLTDKEIDIGSSV